MRCEPLAGGNTTQQELTLCVADGGRGMTAEEQLTCFLPHVHSPTSAGGGTGLGLCICKRFVEALGGSLRVDSAPGQGARFTVVAPVALVDSSDGTPSPSAPCSVGAAPGGGSSATDAPLLQPPMAALVSPAGAAPARPPPMLSSDGRRMRCLLVDDHSMNRRLCGRLLEVQCGLEVATAEDGAVALAALIASRTPGGTPFDFVLMDLQARDVAAWCRLAAAKPQTQTVC
jgi:CheY-like chemotaxis protein